MAFNLVSALRARGKNDSLAQLAADEIERLRLADIAPAIEDDPKANPAPLSTKPAVKAKPAAIKAAKRVR